MLRKGKKKEKRKKKKEQGTICSGVQLQLNKSVFDQKEEKRLENKGHGVANIHHSPVSPERSMSFHIPHFI